MPFSASGDGVSCAYFCCLVFWCLHLAIWGNHDAAWTRNLKILMGVYLPQLTPRSELKLR